MKEVFALLYYILELLNSFKLDALPYANKPSEGFTIQCRSSHLSEHKLVTFLLCT